MKVEFDANNFLVKKCQTHQVLLQGKISEELYSVQDVLPSLYFLSSGNAKSHMFLLALLVMIFGTRV